MPARWAEIESLLPDAQFVDCTSMMNSVRWIKTPAEIALLKEQSADIQDDAHLEVFPTIRPGDRERDVHARFLRSHIERGCHFVHGVLTSHRNTSMYLGESDLVIEAGDIIRTDYVSYLNGYPGHQSRMAVVGEPSPEQARTYADYRDIYLKLIEKVHHRHQSQRALLLRAGDATGQRLSPQPRVLSSGTASGPGGTSRNPSWSRVGT